MSADLERLNLELEVVRATGYLMGTARGVATNLRDIVLSVGEIVGQADRLERAVANLDAATKALAERSRRRRLMRHDSDTPRVSVTIACDDGEGGFTSITHALDVDDGDFSGAAATLIELCLDECAPVVRDETLAALAKAGGGAAVAPKERP